MRLETDEPVGSLGVAADEQHHDREVMRLRDEGLSTRISLNQIMVDTSEILNIHYLLSWTCFLRISTRGWLTI